MINYNKLKISNFTEFNLVRKESLDATHCIPIFEFVCCSCSTSPNSASYTHPFTPGEQLQLLTHGWFHLCTAGTCPRTAELLSGGQPFELAKLRKQAWVVQTNRGILDLPPFSRTKCNCWMMSQYQYTSTSQCSGSVHEGKSILLTSRWWLMIGLVSVLDLFPVDLLCCIPCNQHISLLNLSLGSVWAEDLI